MESHDNTESMERTENQKRAEDNEHAKGFDIECVIEGILFVSGEPVKISRIAGVLEVSEFVVESAANRLSESYSSAGRGIRLVRLEDTLQLCSSPDFTDYIRRVLETRRPPQLSQPALEVLSIIAYFGPVTRAYIEQVRGVDSSYTIERLQERELVESCGRLDAPGRPMLFKTTHNFLRTFGLKSLKELPELPQVESTDDEKEGIQNAILELKAREAELLTESGSEGELEMLTEPELSAESEDAAESKTE